MNMHSQHHPTTSDLDAWRAGLLDATAAQSVATHVAACADCARAARVADALHRVASASPELERQLRVRRRTALAAPARRSALSPKWAVAASMSALALGLALYLGSGDKANAPSLDGDVYADVDFYLWLAERDERTNHAHNPS